MCGEFVLSGRLEARLGIVIECASLQGIGLADGTWDARGPRLGQTPPMRRVRLDGVPVPASATPRGPVAAAIAGETGPENAGRINAVVSSHGER